MGFAKTLTEISGLASEDLVRRAPSQRDLWHHRVVLFNVEGNETFDRRQVV
jgi:hypothetical protein